MIVRERAPRYIALTWQEFCAHIQHDGGWMPREGVVIGHKCEQNTTKTGYFIYEADGSNCVMNEDSVLLFYGDNNEYVSSYSCDSFWKQYEQVIFD